jgi:DNA polymerase-1
MIIPAESEETNMPIQPKKRPIIKKGNGYTYVPASFASEHKVKNFYVSTAEEILSQIEPFELAGRRFFTFDTETHPHYKSSQDVPIDKVRRWVGSGKHATPQDYPFCVSICDGKRCYTLFDTVSNNFAEMRKLSVLFEDPSIEKIAHNTKFDMHMLANAGMKIIGKLHDTVVLAKLIDENRKSFQLRDLAAGLPDGITKFEFMVDAYKQINKVSDYRQIPTELLSEYANADVWNCYQVFTDEYPRLEVEGLQALYDNEMELMVALYAMERYGMKVDVDYEAPLKAELQKLSDEAEAAIYEEAGKMFNINSTKQLYDVIVSLGVDPTLISRTDKGNPKLDKNALANLAEVHNVSIVQKILEYRKYDKLLTTYAEGIYSQRDSADRVHGSINQTEATTGRMSITKPALQTLPKRDKRVRKAFVPDNDSVLWFFDLDQVEYRLFAHYAKLPALLEQIKIGYDVHAATAATLFGRDLDELVEKVHQGDDEATALRSRAKTLNFALIYGMGNQALANDLKVPLTEAENIKARYFSTMPEARVFINTVQQVIKMRGFVKNFFGRRRRLDADDCYKAPNALIQGCAADYIKFKIVRIYKYLMYNKLKTHMTNVVHDEVVINFASNEEQYAPIIRWLMSDFETFRCPITAGAERSEQSWGSKEEKDTGFKQPDNFDFMQYDVFNGDVFNIYK